MCSERPGTGFSAALSLQQGGVVSGGGFWFDVAMKALFFRDGWLIFMVFM